MKKWFLVDSLIAIMLLQSSCAYVKGSYQSAAEPFHDPNFPLTFKAAKLIVDPKPLFENKTVPEKIGNGLVVYPLMLPFAMIGDLSMITLFPIAPLFAWLSYEPPLIDSNTSTGNKTTVNS